MKSHFRVEAKLFFMILLILSFMLKPSCSIAQYKKIDSLFALLKKDKEDTLKLKHLNGLAQQYNNSSIYDSALMLANQAVVLANTLLHKQASSSEITAIKDQLGNSYNDIGIAYDEQGDYPNANNYYLKSLTTYEEVKDKVGKMMVTGNIGILFSKKGDLQKALDYYQEAAKLCEEIKDTASLRFILGNIAVVYQKQSNYPKAADYFKKALKISEEQNDSLQIGAWLTDLGHIAWLQSDPATAFDYYMQSSKIYEELGNQPRCAAIYGAIGLLYNDQGDTALALSYYKKALEIEGKVKDRRGVSIWLTNVGLIYKAQSNFPDALFYLSKSLDIANQLLDSGLIAGNLGNIGDVYETQSKDQDALKYTQRALKIAEIIGDTDEIAREELRIGFIYEKLKNYALAEDYLLKAKILADKTGNGDLRKNAYGFLYELYKQTGRYKEALNHLEVYMDTKDTISKRQNQKQFLTKQMSYEFDKKQAAKQAEHDMQMAVANERTRSQRTYYLLGAGLLLISSLTGFRVYRDKKLNVERGQLTDLARAKIHDIRSNYNDFNLLAREKNPILEDYINNSSAYLKIFLRSWSETQWTIADEMSLLKEFYNAENTINKKVEIVPDFHDLRPQEITFLQGVFPTLLHNSMKYGFVNTVNCQFLISISKQGNVLHCEISDNGEGSDISAYRSSDPDDALNILDSRIANAFKLRSLFSWKKQGIEIQASKETGTTIKFNYPYAKVKNTHS